MNSLVVGKDKSDIFRQLPDTFLIIDDEFHDDRRARRFDISKHTFNPLKDIDYRKAQEFLTVLDAVFPEGANTLTRASSNFLLLRALLSKPKRLSKLISDSRDPYQKDAYRKIQTLLLSPVLYRVLNGEMDAFPFDGPITVRLNRAELGDFDCFVLGNLLISAYQGQVIIPDFGFYACPFHTSLIRQNRLIAGINFLDEAPALKNALLLIEQKKAASCTAEDAEVLASYAGIPKGTNAFTDFVQASTA